MSPLIYFGTCKLAYKGRKKQPSNFFPFQNLTSWRMDFIIKQIWQILIFSRLEFPFPFGKRICLCIHITFSVYDNKERDLHKFFFFTSFFAIYKGIFFSSLFHFPRSVRQKEDLIFLLQQTKIQESDKRPHSYIYSTLCNRGSNSHFTAMESIHGKKWFFFQVV